jgi:hypothetical protein
MSSSSSSSSHLPSSSQDVDAYDEVTPSVSKKARYIPGVSSVEIVPVESDIGRLAEKINAHPMIHRVKFYDDSREQNKSMDEFFALLSNRQATKEALVTLKVCDFIFTLDNKPLLAYERKTLNDLVGSITSKHATEQNANMKYMAKMYHMNRKYVHWLIELDEPTSTKGKFHAYDNDHLKRDAVESFINHRLHLDNFEVVITHGAMGTVYKLLKDLYFILEYIEMFSRYIQSLGNDVPDFDPEMPGIFDHLETWDEIVDFIATRQDVPKISADESLVDAVKELKLNERQLVYAQMLQVIPGITAQYSLLFVKEYPTLGSLAAFLLENEEDPQEIIDEFSQLVPPPTWKQESAQRMAPGRVKKIYDVFFSDKEPLKVRAGKRDKVIH